MSENELTQFRTSLGPAADSYNDVQLAELRRQMYALAELLLDLYMDQKSRTSEDRQLSL